MCCDRVLGGPALRNMSANQSLAMSTKLPSQAGTVRGPMELGGRVQAVAFNAVFTKRIFVMNIPTTGGEIK